VLSVAFSPDGKHIVSSSDDKTVRVWDAELGQAIGEPLQGHSDSVWSVAFSPDGKHIVSGSADNTVRVWDAESGQAIGEPLQGHSDGVWSVAFSPDGKHIVSGSSDNTVQVWDAAFEGTCVSGFSDGSVLHQDGWMTTTDGQLLFWIPFSNRLGLLWPRNTIVIGAKPTQLDYHQFSHGLKWTDYQKC